MPKITIHQFIVRGTYPFPIDMLRYDRCWPARQEDSGRIDSGAPGQFTVRLEGLNVTTPDRWRSFGWHVVEFDAVSVATVAQSDLVPAREESP